LFGILLLFKVDMVYFFPLTGGASYSTIAMRLEASSVKCAVPTGEPSWLTDGKLCVTRQDASSIEASSVKIVTRV
jgi:hypothetical protein